MRKKEYIINPNNITIVATILLFILLYGVGSVLYTGFFSWQVFFNLFIDNAYLIIVATGLSLVIISGGIDLSVGALVAFITMISAYLLRLGLNPLLVILISLGIGAAFGFAQGYIITRFKLHPWIVTLAGMFLARGSCYLISTESIVINNDIYSDISKFKIMLWGGNYISVNVVIAIVVVALFVYISKYTLFGRNIYAIGGNENSALLMGLPVNTTKILAYTICSLCTALGGIVFTFYMLSGYALHCNGMEMDAIAACVIGGILLTGGSGYLIGPAMGVLSSGVIQTIVMFQGTLSSWWTKIAVGFLLFIFIVLQRAIIIRRDKNSSIIKLDKNTTLGA